ncbi:MAG: putative transcriptional regulator of viral defense system [Candidatus Nanohaloarchaea archaeon]|jgi:predicted transcriptional regulator of viral defense system
MRWTEERLAMLEKAVKEDDGELRMAKAFRIYSSREDAKESVKKLEEFGYVENIEPGRFKVKKLPEELEHLENELFEEEGGFVGKLMASMFKRFQN